MPARPAPRLLAATLSITVLATVTHGQQMPADDGPTHDTPLNQETFAQWRAYLTPTVQAQAWREIPWRESFWAGVMDAQKQRKPVLLWAMNGHPLGCT